MRVAEADAEAYTLVVGFDLEDAEELVAVIGDAVLFLDGADRNRRKRFSLRFNLIAGLYNCELSPTKSLSQEVYSRADAQPSYFSSSLPTAYSYMAVG